MQLDFVTLVIAAILINLVSATVIFWSWFNRPSVGERKWAIGLLVESLGFALILTQPVLTPVVSVILPNVLLVIGFTFRYLSVCEFFERKPSHFWRLAPTAVTLVCFILLLDSLHWRIVTAYAVELTQSLAMIWIIMSGAIPGAVQSLKLMRVYGGLIVVIFLFRLVNELANPTAGDLIIASDETYGFAVLVLLSVSLLSSFAVLLVLREKLDAENQKLATLDPLTNISNRRALINLVERELLRSYRTNRWPCLLMLDIDHFKQINDNHGHLVGDQVLVELAALITEQLRDLDVVGRYGGEEFCILLAETDEEGGLISAERLREAIGKMVVTQGDVSVSITASIGLAFSHSGDTLDQLLARADTALYQAKAEGRNAVVVAGA
ncbi:MAG: GGDEF domain-containing protein [Pseudohongiellaceae bacterium]